MANSLSSCVLFLALIPLPAAFALQKADQQPVKPAQPASSDKKTAPKIETPTARLASARNVFIIRSHGGSIPYDTIRTTIDDWQRFTLVNSADKADLIIEVASSGDSGVRVGSSMSPNPETGRMEESTHSSRDLTATEVSMTVLDAHNKRVLWRGTESAKYAVREKARENNLVEAAEKLASKFHDRLEPPERR